MQYEFLVETPGPAMIDVTGSVRRWLTGLGIETGLLTLFVRHTSCSLLIQENADPDVQTDLLSWLDRFVPPASHPSMSYLRHTLEGPDDMPAHIKAALLPTSLSIPVQDGQPVLGTWQGIYMVEHRNRPHRRRIFAHLA